MSAITADRSLDIDGLAIPLRGTYDERFAGVVDAFIENYAREDELGSAVSVVVDGRSVVDLWGGWQDAERTLPWEADTIVCMMSVAKGISAIAFNMLLDRGLVDVDAPVAHYWPEFADNGKAELPVRYLLDHRAGLPVLTPEKLWPGAMFDREAMVSALAAQAPLWEPGTVAAYHVHTQGYLLSEITRRVTGSLLGEFVASEIARPLEADYHLGVDEVDLQRITDLVPNPGARLVAARDAEPADSLRGLAFAQNPPWPWAQTFNSREFRTMDMPSASGHGNARAVARIYGALADGGAGSVRLMSDGGVDRMTEMQHDMIELLQERHYRQGLGVLLNSPDAVYMGPHPEAFGHHGIGGSIGFADRRERVGFSYSMNKMHAVGTNGPRAARLIDAVYAAL
ncbi:MULTISPECIES: serine hydrolase [Microbacterium]|uniref:serine hydrolase domain-containing protein n=1 Tax=Microbacterium TaxID=33882 RepID=UPI002783BF37|nr:MULTISPECIES: serine hydrolase domain-containing protein [Microbacterium]MDQ1075153.1 CubicO group peptidase (beta-lactamase class C family) [Microbacterium sp. SORGH_AS_0969]MDQ1115384.1 CubicO group peptidase (beta-lactamase class C family) [Microbacterium testaceum]